ncbi:glycoside hydrolase family 3 protein [Streptomyces sp. A012304]|uniref:glycoside hydrolase family 3 protein n=1 Tax=Streptomyces sp. A012304 TaxID=375446 RepID=UPI00222F2907|nr:glycoside hydrolase family 3 protein [Streptomyces sp. A012304]GKQ37628.1 beta-N-acetylhexosaminidase [Streptomyces sp. A012304]
MPSRRTVLAATAGLTAALALDGTAHADDRRLRALISRMTLEEKVGQVFVTRVFGHSATAPDEADADANLEELGVRTAAELIARYRVGGVIYFAWAHNTRDPLRISELSNGLQRAALQQPGGVPLLISTDQEHGVVARVGGPATLFPGAMAIGAGGSPGDARTLGRLAGRELRALGIRQNYAPVADVNIDPANPVIGVRSFGADPQAVAALAAAEIGGYRSAGIATTAKHFPGHGDTAVDSHTGFPVITHTRQVWEELDAVPFRAAIAAGVDSILTAHLLVPALDDSGDPATLSRPVLTGLLREHLGYDGVVVTDALDMAGVRTKYGDDRVPVLALKAGADQLLKPPDLGLAWNAVLTAVREGELTEERLEESVLRILRLKDRLGLFADPYVSPAAVERTVGVPAHLAAADRIAERTTTLLVNEGGLLPLSPRERPRLLVVGADPASPSGTTGPPTTVLAAALGDLGFTATALSTGTSPAPEAIAGAVTAAAEADAVIVTTYEVTAGSPQRTLVERLSATGRPVVAVAVRNPYDVAHLPSARACLAAYSWTDVELRAAARVIAGTVTPRGRLPVPVRHAADPAQLLYPIGHGLTY